jgi:hypothetical protein
MTWITALFTALVIIRDAQTDEGLLACIRVHFLTEQSLGLPLS